MKAPFIRTTRTQYHHGNLKEALVEAARAIVAERGPEGLTLTEAAKLAGVTSAAPYRHFSDRQALLSELGRRGFLQFGAALRQAFGTGTPDPASAMRRMGTAYLQFARTEPGLYRAMFSNLSGGAEIAEGQDAFNSLVAATQAVLASFPGNRVNSEQLALKIWALSHGIALLTQYQLMPMPPGQSPESLLSEATEELFQAALSRPRPAGA
ncbi:MAG: TetR/AcrR family transcriptional regulator [Hyphomicrobiales bacterium]|nr:TetR/AcrR family transcriptional regulator [Hyphomicrobiales bacterium]MDE2113489.1 TetR/AcrR family transcriptional regulator [Hyphomicrobiales bacterium]